ncbi:MAG TPA: Uma2 family endonuclease [Flavisolibacter sp.]|jgi:Uma2 family endonuclease|nr:Uma2 family endonuclease [Flavisolibacter sp.]
MAAPALKYKPAKRVSVEEYLRLEEAADAKHEFVDGDVMAMAGATREHNEIVSNLIFSVRICLQDKPCTVYPSDLRVTTPAESNYFYPDATVVRGDVQLQTGVFDTLVNPFVIFEVMSEGTENIDRGYKFFHYQQIPSLQEYILVDSREYVVDIIRRQADGAWKFDKYSPADKQVHLASINCTLSFDNIYYRVQLPKLE